MSAHCCFVLTRGSFDEVACILGLACLLAYVLGLAGKVMESKSHAMRCEVSYVVWSHGRCVTKLWADLCYRVSSMRSHCGLN